MNNYNSNKMKGKKEKFNGIYFFINRLLITGLLTIVCLIVLKKNNSLRESFYNKFLSTDFNFAYINNLYKEYFGGSIPFGDLFSSAEPVFNETLVYDGYQDYLDGVSLNVSENYLVPILESGLVVFVGQKDDYGNTVIIQQADGINVWYSNLDDISVKLYEYVNGGNYIGSCSGHLYLVFKKDGNVLDFKKFI